MALKTAVVKKRWRVYVDGELCADGVLAESEAAAILAFTDNHDVPPFGKITVLPEE